MNIVSELVVDAYGCKADLSDAASLESAALKAAESVGATVADRVTHRFQPHGLTICLILKESHLIISTWPEHSLAIVNIFLCNPKMDTSICWKVLSDVLNPSQCTFHTVKHRIQSAASQAA